MTGEPVADLARATARRYCEVVRLGDLAAAMLAHLGVPRDRQASALVDDLAGVLTRVCVATLVEHLTLPELRMLVRFSGTPLTAPSKPSHSALPTPALVPSPTEVDGGATMARHSVRSFSTVSHAVSGGAVNATPAIVAQPGASRVPVRSRAIHRIAGRAARSTIRRPPGLSQPHGPVGAPHHSHVVLELPCRRGPEHEVGAAARIFERPARSGCVGAS